MGRSTYRRWVLATTLGELIALPRRADATLASPLGSRSIVTVNTSDGAKTVRRTAKKRSMRMAVAAQTGQEAQA